MSTNDSMWDQYMGGAKKPEPEVWEDSPRHCTFCGINNWHWRGCPREGKSNE